MPRISARKNWRVFSLVLSQIAEYKERIVIAFACLLLARLMFVAMPFVLKHVVDNLANLGTSSGKIFATATLSLVFLYATIRLINVLLDEIRENLFGRVTERIACLVNSFSFQHLHALDLSFHLNRSTGAIFREIQRGTTGIETLLQYSTFNIIPTIIEIILIFFIFSFNYGITFATIVLISVLLFTITSILASEWNSRFMRKVNETESAISNSAIESLLNYETIKYFTNEYFESKRYEEKLRAWERSKGRQRLALSRTVSLQALIVSISIAITLSISVVGVFEGNLEIGDFVLINAFMMQIFIPLNYLGFIYKESKNSMVDIENLLNLLSIDPKINYGESKNNFSRCETKIEFRNVSFRYHNGREILKSVSFTIKRGEKVAIVGESGAGKSTIAKLLFRFFDCDSGCIEIDGKNIKDLDLESLRGQIGVVPQDIVLFNNSIVENVRYGRPSANLEEIENAIELSGLSQLISILPNGQHTIVGERGLKLSGGEKQRLGIARAILKRPSIWVFDEATSSLDSESESLMNKSISQVSRADLNLVISHRLSAVVDADKILVLAGGRMVEEGDHQSLLQSDGIYARIWKHQQDLQLMTK